MLTLRHLTVRDIPQMMPINEKCFPIPWSARTIKTDLTTNPYSEWIVLEGRNLPDKRSWRSLLYRSKPYGGQIIGFGAFWVIAGEMHITNIGIDPAYRGYGYGEVLLLTLLKRAIQIDAEFATLEVRVSNDSAIRLYRKYAYEVVGRKFAYYHDNLEDAFDMATEPFNSHYLGLLRQHEQTLQHRFQWSDEVVKGNWQ